MRHRAVPRAIPCQKVQDQRQLYPKEGLPSHDDQPPRPGEQT